MTLKSLNLKGSYSWTKDSLLNDFYIPVLSESIYYDRWAGYFCSNSLASASKGIYNFLENGGKMRILCNIFLSEEDQKVIKKVILDKEKEILGELSSSSISGMKKNHLELLAWLMKNNRLEIRVAHIPGAIEHKKGGIFKDSKNNIVSFTGSVNETSRGWQYNDESFHVHCNWVGKDFERHIKPDMDDFESMWKGESKVSVYTLSEAFKKELIKKAPKNETEMHKINLRCKEKITKKIISGITKKIKARNLFYYQEEARDCWINNHYKGFFEMATGTGKTFTAIASIKELLKKEKLLEIIIAVPSIALINQWKSELIKEGCKKSDIIHCSSSSSVKWREVFRRNLLLESSKAKIFIFTYQSLMDKKVQDIITISSKEMLIVCDEMHHAGAPGFSNCLNKRIKYRLDLSATPTRMLDEEGNDVLWEYFGKKPLFVFNIERALNEINPLTGETYLCPYNYHIKTVELSLREHHEFKRLSKIIGSQIGLGLDLKDLHADKTRALLISCASGKINLLNQLIKEIKSSRKNKRMLFYCQSFKSKDSGEKQIESVKKIIKGNNLNYLEYTSKINDIRERDKIIKALEEEKVDAIVAIKCLDEGVDIPSVKTAVILASSSNSSEFIQRRGRVLRRSPKKINADIYDFLVGPPITGELTTSDITLIRREYLRGTEYAKHSLNPKESGKNIYNWLMGYGLTKEDIIDGNN